MSKRSLPATNCLSYKRLSKLWVLWNIVSQKKEFKVRILAMLYRKARVIQKPSEENPTTVPNKSIALQVNYMENAFAQNQSRPLLTPAC